MHPSGVFGNMAPEIHDPQHNEIEQIMREVGVRFYQVVPESTLSTAYRVSDEHQMWININSTKQLCIYIESMSMPTAIDVNRHKMSSVMWFSIYEPDFFIKLARHLKQKRVLSIAKYWWIRLKLWWNK